MSYFEGMEPLDTLEPRYPIIATLHSGGATGSGEVTVSGLLLDFEFNSTDDAESALQESEAIELLYDFARSHLTPQLSMLDIAPDLPRKAPVPELRQFEQSEELKTD